MGKIVSEFRYEAALPHGYRFWGFNRPRSLLRGMALQTVGVCSYAPSLTRKAAYPSRFVMFGGGRVGKTLLNSLLCSHPDVRTRGEVFYLYRIFPYHWLRSNLWYFARHEKTFGFELKFWHPYGVQHQDGGTFISRLDELNFKFIYLHRENWFLQILSGIKSYDDGVWHADTNGYNPGNFKCYVDKARLLSALEKMEGNFAWEQMLLKHVSRPMIELRYERDLLDPHDQRKTAARCFSFLGLSNVDVTNSLRQPSSPNWWDDVANPDDVCRWLEEAGYGHFLSLHTVDYRQVARAGA